MQLFRLFSILFYCGFVSTISAQVIFQEQFNDSSFRANWNISSSVEQAYWLGVEQSKYVRFHPRYQNQSIQTPTIYTTNGNYSLFFDWNKVGTNTIDSVQVQLFNNNTWHTIYAVYNGNNRTWQTDTVSFTTNQDSIKFKWNYFSSGTFPSQYFNIDNISLQKNTPTALFQNKNEISFNVFPNPSNGQFQLKISNHKSLNGKILIFSTSGALVYESILPAIPQSLVQLDLSTLSKGTYILQVLSADNLFSKSIIIQ